ncbi:MAG TPA: DapH/DapD/GlmU-related protein [Capsulimonadaceae bacterium]|nr:DapH/DapD/GlmU-related protein [Capsulimonadaceae bacterium]
MFSFFSRLTRYAAYLSQLHPAPRPVVALYLRVRWHARVDPWAEIDYPFRLSLGRDAEIGRCRIDCDGDITIGAGTVVHSGSILDAMGGKIVVGDHSVIMPYCVLYGNGGLYIGSRTALAPHTVVVASNHGFADMTMPIIDQPMMLKGISIADNVWIGANASVLDGVGIGEGAVIGAGSVVTRDIPCGAVAVGSPAHVVKMRQQAGRPGVFPLKRANG